MTFKQKFETAAKKNDSLVCVGLDVDLEQFPAALKNKTPYEAIVEFNRSIIEATKDLVCAYKPNSAFYEAYGLDGYRALKETIKLIPKEIPVILDAKRGDIGNTAAMYAKAVYEEFGVDAVTVNPYLGEDSVQPFLAYEEKAVVLLVRTSNPSAKEFQDLLVEGKPLYQKVVETALGWERKADLLFVVGATYPEEAQIVRDMALEIPFLVPGLGKQGGEVEAAVKNSIDAQGLGAIFNSSRGIIYASEGEDYAEAAKKACEELREQINSFR